MADSLQFLRLDYQSQRDALIQRVQARYPGAWNDFLSGSFGVVLLDGMAWCLTTFAYTVNKLAGENFVSTMTRRESAVRLGNLTGYTLANPTPATVLCQATISAPASQTVTISAGTPIKTTTQPALTFEFDQDYTISVGQTAPSRVVVTFDPAVTALDTISALVSLTNNQAFADVLDPALDLRQLVQPGQTLIVSGNERTISSVTVGAQPGTYNRLVMSQPWTGTTGYFTAQVVERRIAAVEGQTRTELFSGTGAALACRLANSPVIAGSTAVTVNGEDWTQVTYLSGQDSQASVFQLKNLPDGTPIVLFGDGAIGRAVPTNAQVTVSYRVGGGSAGNVAAGALNATVLGRLSSGSTVSVRINNLSAGQGGAEAETVDTARRQIPASTRAGDRAVTLADYQALAVTWTGGTARVAHAKASADVSAGFSGKNVVTVTAWANGKLGLEPLREPSRSGLQAYLQTKACGTDFVAMADGSSEPFPLAVRIQVSPGYSVDDVEATVLSAVGALVAADEPGSTLSYASIVTAVDSVPGVGISQVAVPAGDVAPAGDTAVFSAPAESSSYEVELTSVSAGKFTGSLPFTPRYAWTIDATLGGNRLSVSPDVEPGYARMSGSALSTDNISRVNLATGLVELYSSGAVARFIIELTSIQGYDQVRSFDAFVDYSGDSSLSKRREIRSALRAWASGLAVGQTVFASGGQGASMEDVVEAQSGVLPNSAVVRIGAPGGAVRDDPLSSQLPSLRRVVVNGYTD